MTSKGKHLNLSNRNLIEQGLNNNSTKTAIAEVLGMDKSSICKEIKNHAYDVKFSRSGVSAIGTYDCQNIASCGFNNFCKAQCPKRIPIPCNRRDKKGVCNGCDKLHECKLTKRMYSAEQAHKEYLYTLSDVRQGVNLNYSEAKEIADIIVNPIKLGQSVYAVLQNHPEIPYCEKTIYNWIALGVFEQFGLVNLDLRNRTSRKITKSEEIKYKKREIKAYLKGRTYDYFDVFMKEHPSASVVEMDTVYNDGSNGPFIQTFMFVDFGIMIGVYHTVKNATTMFEGVKYIHDLLGNKLFKSIFQVLLTDRGPEFSAADEFETLVDKVFYCDPMASWQKPHVENNHRLLRYICPKEKDLKKLGLVSQDDVDIIFSHINSYPREEKYGKSPIEEFIFYHKDGPSILNLLKISEIPKDEVTLNPSLIKK